jgi:preprotein translocase subunit SecE
MWSRIADSLGWVGLGLLVAGLVARAWPAAREPALWVMWAGLAVVGVFVVLRGRDLVARVREWWGRGRTFLSEVRTELGRVTWPSRKEVYATTFVVIVTSIVLGLYLWGVDLVVNRLVGFIFRRLGAA